MPLPRQLDLFPEALQKKKLPTNTTANHHPVHRWFNFIAGFSPEFVNQCIREAKLDADDVIIDPFAGLSTTLVQASFENIQSVGFEAHTFFYDISLAKILPPTQKRQIDEIEDFIQSNVKSYTEDFTDIWTPDAETFLKKLIPASDLSLLASAMLLESHIETSKRSLYRLILSRVLELTAQSQTDGIYKAPTTEKCSVPYQIALQKVCNEVREDIPLINDMFRQKATLYPLSSEKMSPLTNESCSLCVTSPPYLNNFDYAEMTRMELYYWRYAGSWREITERVRRRLIVNTTTAPTDLKRAQDRFSATLSDAMRSQLQPVISDLKEQRRIRDGKKDYYLLVYPYFSQMQSIIREVFRVLKPGSSFHLVVADAALYGVHIPTEQLLATLMRETGFGIQEIERLRDRGDRWVLEKRASTKKPLGEFHIHARRI